MAANNARKLVGEDHVDALMGSVALLPTSAIAEIANASKTPLLALAPVSIAPEQLQWVFVLPQRTRLMMRAVVDHMKARGVRNVGYIGYSDTWSDFILNAFTNEAWAGARIQMVSNERYARSDSSVAAQVGKLIAANPDAILVGGSGSGGALPHVALGRARLRKANLSQSWNGEPRIHHGGGQGGRRGHRSKRSTHGCRGLAGR